MATKGRIQYKVSAGNRLEIPDYKMEGSTATEITGFTIINNEGYCLKENAAGNKSTLFRIQEVNSAQVKIRGKKVLNYGTFGMTYNGNFVYIAVKGSKVIKTSAVSDKDTPVVYSVKDNGKAVNPQAIAHYTGSKFIIMANALNSGNYLCFLVGTFSDGSNEFVEDSRFYVRNTSGNTQLQDIHYESKLGLFIVTNKMSGSSFGTSSTIMRAEIDQISDENHNGYPLYHPVAEYVFSAKDNRYSRLSVESIAFSTNGILYMATNTEPAESSASFKTGGLFFINNITFGKSYPTSISYSCNKGVGIDKAEVTYEGVKYLCQNPGALAINENTAYCLRTHKQDGSPISDQASILLSSKNVTSINLSRVPGSPVLKNMGHGNGMTYYNGFLYVAAYDRRDAFLRKEIRKLSLDGKTETAYQCDNIIGGISHYKDNQFIVVNYDTSPDDPYTKNPEFFIGHLANGSFIKDKTFCAKNPSFSADSANYLQDIFYTPEHGLFFITLVNKVSRIYRITPEQIETSSPSNPIMPKEVYVPADTSIHEVESLATNNNSTMFIAENYSGDAVKQMLNIKFYKDTI